MSFSWFARVHCIHLDLFFITQSITIEQPCPSLVSTVNGSERSMSCMTWQRLLLYRLRMMLTILLGVIVPRDSQNRVPAHWSEYLIVYEVDIQWTVLLNGLFNYNPERCSLVCAWPFCTETSLLFSKGVLTSILILSRITPNSIAFLCMYSSCIHTIQLLQSLKSPFLKIHYLPCLPHVRNLFCVRAVLDAITHDVCCDIWWCFYHLCWDVIRSWSFLTL